VQDQPFARVPAAVALLVVAPELGDDLGVGLAETVVVSSGTGMGCLVDRPKAFAGEMGVDLRGGEVGVAEQLLHGPQVRTTFEQVRSVGVPEDVWVQGVPIGHRVAVHDAPVWRPGATGAFRAG
jgi:hypothetical protein